MSHFAEIGPDSVVIRVIVADQDFINSGAVGDPARWVQTSYSGAIRGRFAGVGSTYRVDLDAFIPPSPFDSWVIDEVALEWVAPIPRPIDGDWFWDEAAGAWLEAPPAPD